MKRTSQWIALLALCLSVGLTSCAGETTPSPTATETRFAAIQTATPKETESARPRVEEIRFQSGDFKLEGDLRFPEGGGPYPAIIMVHGDGPATRNGAVPFGPMIETFTRNGYAVFSWDKPGSGGSTGEFEEGKTITGRAKILADGIDVLVTHPQIDPDHLGLWGLSQAGWVMPLALELTDDIAFMIVVSGGAEDSIEQMVYMFGQQLLSTGTPLEELTRFEQYGAQALKATTYVEYREAMEILLAIPGVERVIDLEMAAESEWQPWPRDIDAFFDPMEIIERTTIPMLVVYGELDKNIDPVQGAKAYKAALQTAGNEDYQIVVIPGSAHVFVTVPAYLDTLEAWLQHLPQ